MANRSKARAVKPFYDKAAGLRRAVGDVFDCTAKRLAEINGTRHGVLAVKVAPEPRGEEE